jgi:hypothetical protein
MHVPVQTPSPGVRVGGTSQPIEALPRLVYAIPQFVSGGVNGGHVFGVVHAAPPYSSVEFKILQD